MSFKRECPICGGENKLFYTCSECWDRYKLSEETFRMGEEETEEYVENLVRKLKLELI
jgi:primosomal protein N'